MATVWAVLAIEAATAFVLAGLLTRWVVTRVRPRTRCDDGKANQGAQ